MLVIKKSPGFVRGIFFVGTLKAGLQIGRFEYRQPTLMVGVILYVTYV